MYSRKDFNSRCLNGCDNEDSTFPSSSYWRYFYFITDAAHEVTRIFQEKLCAHTPSYFDWHSQTSSAISSVVQMLNVDNQNSVEAPKDCSIIELSMLQPFWLMLAVSLLNSQSCLDFKTIHLPSSRHISHPPISSILKLVFLAYTLHSISNFLLHIRSTPKSRQSRFSFFFYRHQCNLNFYMRHLR